MDLESRYARIRKCFEALTDFPEEELAKSRALFHLEADQVVPRRFEVWTCLVGLRISDDLTRSFQKIVARVEALLPLGVRFYRVVPANYHWELFIIKRPDEEVDPDNLRRASEIFGEVLSQHAPFTISYRGFLVTTEGVIIVKGYGDFDWLRKQLRERIPFASPRQSDIGHVSLGRILDPIDHDCFAKLKSLVNRSQDEFYGELMVNEAKYVHEMQWYMEDRELIATLPLGIGFHETTDKSVQLH